VVFTKLDLLGEQYAPPIHAPDAFAVLSISAANREVLDQLLSAWWAQLLRLRTETREPVTTEPLP